MQEQSLFTNQPQGITLSQFNDRISRAINVTPGLQNQWVIAETSDLRVVRGHCYMELVEKDDHGTTVAKLGAVIWASTFVRLNAKFQAAMGTELKTGMKLLVLATANYHSQYGFKAVINDIDPSYTMGDMARQRLEILKRLKADGIIDMNKELPITAVPQRIAVISAAGAAGYGDFMNQLEHNPYRLKFYTCLFGASMQGSQTVPTVLAALDRINEHLDLFDAVVIIRGGGATSELNSFDNYDLAAAVAQFPLPVIVGIGHDRDETVLDYVAAIRVHQARQLCQEHPASSQQPDCRSTHPARPSCGTHGWSVGARHAARAAAPQGTGRESRPALSREHLATRLFTGVVRRQVCHFSQPDQPRRTGNHAICRRHRRRHRGLTM